MVYREVYTEVLSDCGVCTDEQELYTEAMRMDEVAHHAEVQSSGNRDKPK
ncbi:hypothetical protein V8V91_25820 [Algoriphagus halophilus]